MSALQERLLDAMSILSQTAVINSGATLTIECEIIETIDAGIGQYKVKYAENQFDAYSNPSAVYQKGDIVFVLVPNGDLTKTLTIIGGVTPKASTYVALESSDSYVPISGNLFTSVDNIELCSYHSETRNLGLDNSNFNIIFNDYLNEYRNFVFTAKVKTNIPLQQQQGGNYGLILQLPFLEDAGTGTGLVPTYKAISIDVNTMQGNPYRFNEYSLQNIYFEIAEGAQYDTSRDPILTVFVQDFVQDDSDLPADIWITDIGLKTVDVLSEEDKAGYSLTLVASEGNYFLNNTYLSYKTLSPVLKVNGKTKNVKGYECYWFVEDTSININSDGYFRLGGLGWKCLNKKTNVQYNEEGKMTYQYVTNIYTLKVSSEDVFSTLRYKCVLVKDDIVVGGSLYLKNLNSNIEMELISATGSSTFVKNTGYINLIARIYYPGVSDNLSSAVTIETAWQRFDQNTNFIDDNFYEFVRINDRVNIPDKSGIERTWLETEIKFPCSLVENYNTINCSFYGLTVKNNNRLNNILGTVSLIVNTSDDFNYKLVIDNGDVLYKYDADGDSPMIADYDGPASSKVKEILPLSYRVFKNDGTELNDIEYQYCQVEWKIPKNSMIKLKTTKTKEDDNYEYVVGRGKIDINYTIIDTYNIKKVDNSILLTVTFNNNILTEVANIKFLKDGESGTNGSKYAGIITYQGYRYGELNNVGKPHKLHPVLVVNSWKLVDSITGNVVSWANPRLDISVYCDGELMTTGYSVIWRIFDSTMTNPLFNINNGILSPKGTSWSDNTSTIVEAEIKVGNAGITGSQEVIYAYYPIEITYLPIINYQNGLIPNLTGGFSEVLYAADGTNPKYDNTNPFVYADNLTDIDATSYYSYNWTVGGNLTAKANNNLCTVKPLTKFDNGKSLNYVNVGITITANGRTQVNNLISQLTTKANLKSNEISYNQGVKQHILDFVGNFSYTNYIKLLDSSKELLLYRGNLLYYIDQLNIILNDLYDYCLLKNIETNYFDYINIININKNKLTIEKRKLYRLGYYVDLYELNNLSNLKITLDAESITNRYGLGVYNTLNSYIIKFNNILDKKYLESYNLLCAKVNNIYVLKKAFDDFKLLENNLISIYNNINLIWLQSSQYGFGPEQEFINLRNQLIAIINKLFDINGYCYSYDSIKQEILDECNNLIVKKYGNEYYITIYNNRAAAAQVELNEINEQLADSRKIITNQTNGTIKHSKPIVMLFNRYELSNINGWDGNKLYVDQNNNEYLLAPQVGAGVKNGTFTGVIMGVKQFNHQTTQQIGLFGYSSGIQSFFLNAEDGSATFGKSGGGQIYIQPGSDTAIIKSGNYSISDKTGMQINLTTPEIRFGSGNFVVDKDGKITAKGGGTIAGWNISDTQLYSNVSTSSGRLTLDSTSYGKIYSHNHTSLGSTNTGFYLGYDGLSIGNTIKVTAAEGGSVEVGRLSGSKKWTISGDSSNSYISYGTKGNNGSVYIGTDEIHLGAKLRLYATGALEGGTNDAKKWAITQAGDATFNSLTANKSGSIGGWTISNDKLSSGNIELKQNGSIKHTGGDWEIAQNGNATFKKLYASNSGTIAGWKIRSDSLEGGNMKIKSDGSMSGSNWSINASGEAKFDNVKCTSTWEFGKGTAKWSNNGFSFGMGNYGSIANNGFTLSNASTSWNSKGFSGDGNASYSSTKDEPFKGKCVTHIQDLCVKKITAKYISGEIANLDLLTVKNLKSNGNIGADGSISAKIISAGKELTVNGVNVEKQFGNIANSIADLKGDLKGKADKKSYEGSCYVTDKDGNTLSGKCNISLR